jgi:outer membrane protein assembly factor BamB
LLTLIFCFNLQAQSSAHWPQWRGPFFNGMARGDAPSVWSDTTNIKWKTEIPGRGFSTPAIWGDRIFVTTAIPTGSGAGTVVEQRFEVLSIDRKTGKIIWQKTARTAMPHEGYHRAYGSFASNSPVTDGKYVYASFGSRGIYAYDFNGKLIWEKDLGVQMKMRLAFGEGTAQLLFGDRLFVVFDHEGESFMVALDKRNGKELWRVSRNERSSWSTPLAVEHNGRTEIVVSATNRVRSYDPETGKVLWESGGLGANVIPVPVHQNGVVYVMSGYRDPKLMAIKLGRQGDLTGSDAIVWSHTRGLAYTASPVLHEGKLYVVTDNGMLSAFNATTGETYYAQTRLPKGYNLKASPIGANGKLYLATEDGDVVVVKMGEKFEILSTNTLTDQVFIATPVIAAGELYLRSKTTLFCIAEKK